MNTRFWLIVSLVANLALGAAFLTGKRSASTTVATTTNTTVALAPAATPPTAKPGTRVVTVTNTTDAGFDWRRVESADYKEYIANLRAIGCPEETIRDIIVADVNKLFEDRKKALRAANTNKFQYWKAGGEMFAKMFNEEAIQQNQALAKEKRDLLTQLLGSAPEEKPDLAAASGMNQMMEQMLDFLSPSQQTQVMEIEQKFAAKLMKAMGDGGGGLDSMADMQKVQKEKEAELAKILSPAEFEDYQLRMSQTAMIMRMQLSSFDPNEQEFKDIFKAKKAFEDEFGMAASMGGARPTEKAEREKYDAAKKAMDDQLRNQLGERYSAYERSQDFAFQSLYSVAKRQGLPQEAAVSVYEMKKTAEAEAKRLRADKSLNAEQRNAALAAIANETENSVKQTLGEKGFQAYQKNNGAYWLKSLQPPSTTKP